MSLDKLINLAVGKKILTPSPYKDLSKKEAAKEKIREQITGKKLTEERANAIKESAPLKQRQKAELKEAFKESSGVTKALSKTPVIEGALKTAKGVPRSTRGIGLALGGVAALNYFAPSMIRTMQNSALFGNNFKFLNDLADDYDNYYAPYSGTVEYGSLLGLRYLESAKEAGKNKLTSEVKAELTAEEQATRAYKVKELQQAIEATGGKTSATFLENTSPEVFKSLQEQFLPKVKPILEEAPKVSKFSTPFRMLKTTTMLGGRLLPAVGSAINYEMYKEYEKQGDKVGAKLRQAQMVTSAAEATPAVEVAAPASLALEAADDLLNYVAGNNVRKKQFIASAITGTGDTSFNELFGLPKIPKGAEFKPLYSKKIKDTGKPFEIEKEITPFGSARSRIKPSLEKQIFQPQDENAPLIGAPEYSTYDLFQTKPELKNIDFKPKAETPAIQPKIEPKQPIIDVPFLDPLENLSKKTSSYQPSILKAGQSTAQSTSSGGNDFFKKTIAFDVGSKDALNEKMIYSLRESIVSALKENQATSAYVDNSVSIAGNGSGGSDSYTSSQRGDPINHMRTDLRYKLNKIV